MNPLIKSHNRSSDLHCDHFDGAAVFSSLPLGAPNYVASVRLSDLLCEYFKSSSSLQSAFYIVGWFVTLYRFFPYGEGFSFTWFQRYFYDLQTALSEILAGKVGYITELVAVTIIVTGILLFAVFSIYIQHFYIVYGAMCLYLLTVVILMISI